MRHLATIRKIKELRPIPKADRIEVAVIDGWECVVNKSDGFKVGDLIVYIEIDSVLPPKPEFAFMEKYKYRVKTIKLRGQVSQGLVLPMKTFDGMIPDWEKFSEGEDVTGILGIKKYDPFAEKEKVWYQKLGRKVEFPWWLKPFKRIKFIRNWWLNKNKTIDDFPPFIKKTDEERIQNLPELFEDIKKRQISLVITEKMDGTSATYFLHDGKFGVCSRNKWLLKDDGSPYWAVANENHIEQILRSFAGERGNKKGLYVLQGEIIGHGIQKNKYHLSGFMFMPFNMIINHKRLPYNQMKNALEFTSLNCVPYLDERTIPEKWEIQDFVEYAKGTSLYRDGLEPREGIVCRNQDKGVSFKIINPDFLLKEDE